MSSIWSYWHDYSFLLVFEVERILLNGTVAIFSKTHKVFIFLDPTISDPVNLFQGNICQEKSPHLHSQFCGNREKCVSVQRGIGWPWTCEGPFSLKIAWWSWASLLNHELLWGSNELTNVGHLENACRVGSTLLHKLWL